MFTAPEAGYYSFAADFESMTDARGTEVRVVQDDLVSALWSVRLDAYGGTNVAASFDGILNMAAGEKVYFSNPAEGYEMPTMVDFNCVAALVDPEDLPEPPAWALKLWLKADTGVTTSEGVVTAWADQSGNGLDAALDAGNPMLATGSFNNGDHPVIRFDGDDALVLYDNTEPNEDPNIGNPLGLSSLSIYVVGKINANQAGSGFIVNSNVYTGWAFGVSSVEQNKFGLLSANNELRPPNPSLVDKYYLIACTISSDYQRNLYINGNLRASDNGGVNYYGDTAALIGYLLAGDIAEIRVYQGVDETENAAVQAALIDEYALNFTCFDQGVYFQADLNEDCYVNLDDVALLAGDWLKCNDPYNPDQCDPMPDPPLPPLPLPDPGAFEVKTWDYNADYPTATGGPNPNGQWYYGYLTNSVGNYPFRFAPANNYHPVPPSGNTLDIFWGNDAEGAFGKNPWPTDSDAPTWPNGMFFPADSTYLMNPGTAVRENKTTVRFVSSFEATYEVHAQFESGVTQGFDTPVYVLVNGVTVFADVISGFQDNPENNIATFSAKIALPLHGIVDFALDYIPGEGNTEPTWPNGGFHIVTFDANVTSSAYNPDDFPKPFNPADYPLDPNDADDPNNPVLIPMSPLQDPDPAPELPPLPDSDKVFLTAMTFSDTDASGNTQNLIWNTFYDGVEPAWDLALHAGTVDVYDPNVAADPNKDFWLNNDTDMMLNVPLVVGNSYDFTIHKAYYADGGPLAIVGLNLFFDDQQNSNTVGVSVYADSDTTGPGDGNPEWFAKDGIEVAGWPYTGPGYGGVGGGLTYKNYNKLIQVTITDWVYYPTTIYNIDSITRSDWDYPLVGPDGAADNIAQFSLVVEPFLLTCEEVGEYYDNDFNEDCYINLADYAEIAGDWLKCNDPEIPTCTDVPN